MNYKQLLTKYCHDINIDIPSYDSKAVAGGFCVPYSNLDLIKWESIINIPGFPSFSYKVLGTKEDAEDFVSREMLNYLVSNKGKKDHDLDQNVTEGVFIDKNIKNKQNNPKNLLQEFCDKYKINHPVYETTAVFIKAEPQKWECKLTFIDKNLNYSYISSLKTKKVNAEFEVAEKLLEFLVFEFERRKKNNSSYFVKLNEIYHVGHFLFEMRINTDDTFSFLFGIKGTECIDNISYEGKFVYPDVKLGMDISAERIFKEYQRFSNME